MSKLVIVAAPAGGMQQSREAGGFVPMQPRRIAEEACRRYQAGASVIYIHASRRAWPIPGRAR